MNAAAKSGIVVVMTTVDDAGVADEMARELVSRRAAACVQCAPVRSHYRWEEEIRTEVEVLLLVKTGDADRAMAVIEELHPYDVPEILVLGTDGGLQDYVDWVRTETERV